VLRNYSFCALTHLQSLQRATYFYWLVLNITPDSFFDGGKYKNEADIIRQVEKMLYEGATFIDVGACSSRPGATPVSEEEELKRIVPVINLLLKNFPEIIISIV